MVVATALAILGLGLACWLVFTLAVHALPAAAGVLAGMLAYHTGAGAVGAILVSMVVGAIALVLGQTLFAEARSRLLRAVVAAAYAAPAAFVGYRARHGILAAGVPSEVWREVFAVAGASVIAGVAWARVRALAPGHAGQGRATTSVARLP